MVMKHSGRTVVKNFDIWCPDDMIAANGHFGSSLKDHSGLLQLGSHFHNFDHHFN